MSTGAWVAVGLVATTVLVGGTATALYLILRTPAQPAAATPPAFVGNPYGPPPVQQQKSGGGGGLPWGTIGGIAGLAFGGPAGGAIGSQAGNAFGSFL